MVKGQCQICPLLFDFWNNDHVTLHQNLASIFHVMSNGQVSYLSCQVAVFCAWYINCLLSHLAACITVLFLVKSVNLILFLFSLFATGCTLSCE